MKDRPATKLYKKKATYSDKHLCLTNCSFPPFVFDSAKNSLRNAVNIQSFFAHQETPRGRPFLLEAISRFPLVALDTEFPGTFFQLNRDKSSLSHATPYENYCLMKWNVDLLKIIQLGMTLSDSHGNLPSFGTEFHYAWQFIFRDFNIEHDHHNEESIGLLERQGTDLKKNREKGIDSSDFGRLILSSGLVSNNSSITWITFHGAYDFGFLIKILTKRELPSDMRSFLGMMRFFFGVRVYDTKFMMGCISGLHGGLERAAMLLGRI
ncbi:hypothetical protein NC651_000473 [Populus alba x Populus x berolinensis]|nr:hypothetical protein NC651_000473 [Populus alba x Populus x berolinensis]